MAKTPARTKARKSKSSASKSQRSKSLAAKSRAPKSPPLRFAHPFFTSTPSAARAVQPATGTRNMSQFASAKLGPIPPPTRDPSIDLKDIIGQPGVDEI